MPKDAFDGLDLDALREDNLTDAQKRVIADIYLRMRDLDRENRGMRASRRIGLTVEEESYRERFGDERHGVDHEHGGIVLDLVPEHSRLDTDEGNLVIEGDNVDALRVLSRTHKGRFDCVFIDPPYNTESTTFVYNDKQVGENDKARYSMWISGLKRRIVYVADLLSDRGVLLVSINDKNRDYVKLAIDSILPGKFRGAIVWRSRSGKNEPGNGNLSVDHEHVLVYANDGFEFGGRAKDKAAYKFNDHDGAGVYTRGDLTSPKTHIERPLTYYPIQDPDTGVWYPANPDAVWRYATQANLKPGQKLRKDTMENLIAANKIAFPRDKRVHVWHTREELDAAIAARDVPVNGKGVPLLRAGLPGLDFFVGKPVGWGVPAYKRHLSEVKRDTKPLSSWVGANSEMFEGDDADYITSGLAKESEEHLKAIFGEKVFNYAKPPSLITNLIRQATTPESMVLDFFGGSGTTAEAVLRINQEDGGSRRFVLVSNTERSDEDPDKNLCRDVLAPRVRAVMEGFEKGGKPVEGTGGGFAYLRAERVHGEAVEGYTPFALTHARIWTVISMLEDAPVAPLALEGGFALIRKEGRLVAFAPVWDDVDEGALTAAFRDAPESEHSLYADDPDRALRDLAAAGLASVRAEDAWVRAGRICGPVR